MFWAGGETDYVLGRMRPLFRQAMATTTVAKWYDLVLGQPPLNRDYIQFLLADKDTEGPQHVFITTKKMHFVQRGGKYYKQGESRALGRQVAAVRQKPTAFDRGVPFVTSQLSYVIILKALSLSSHSIVLGAWRSKN